MKERFDLRKFARTALLATTLAACGSGADKTPQPANTPNPTPGATENFIKTPEIVKSPSDLAKEAILSLWINTLNGKQYFSDSDNTYSSKTDLTNIDVLNSQKDLIFGGGKLNSTLNVSYIYENVSKNSRNPEEATVFKIIGNIQIADVQIIANQSPLPLTDVDKRNGIQWHGTPVIKYIYRFSQNDYYPAKDNSTGDWYYVPMDQAQNWLDSLTVTSPKFSDFKPGRYSQELVLINGSFKSLGIDSGYSASIPTIENGKETTLGTLFFPIAEFDPSKLAPGYCSNPCQFTRITPPK